jgi:hypothetical protein
MEQFDDKNIGFRIHEEVNFGSNNCGKSRLG